MAFFDSHFDHPDHGNFTSPEDVLNSQKLSDSEKRTVLQEWRDSLQHILRDDSDAPEVKARSEGLDRAMDRLAAAKT